MKILLVVHSFPPHTIAGTEVYTEKLSRQLSREHEIHVFFRVNNKKEGEYSLKRGFGDIKTYSLNRTLNSCRSFEETYSDKRLDEIFGKLLDEIKPDIIHIQHLLFLSLGIITEARKREIPIAFTLNDYWLFCHKGQLLKQDFSICQKPVNCECQHCLISQLAIKKNTIFLYNKAKRNLSNIPLQILKRVYLCFASMFFLSEEAKSQAIQMRLNCAKEVFNDVDLFIAPSRFIKNKFISFGVASDKIIYSPYGIDLKKLPIHVKSPSKEIRFGYIGTLLPMKGVNILIAAFKKIKSTDIKLFIYGRQKSYAGYESYYQKLNNMIKLDCRIHLMGSFDNNDISEVMADINILIVPSIWQENSPIVIQEAFATKTPVIASRIGGIPELIDDGVNGLLFNPGDIADLKQKMELIALAPGMINKFKDNMPKIKSIEENAQELTKIYREISDRLKKSIAKP